MLQSDAAHEFEKFLEGTENLEVIHLVLSGAVVSGEFVPALKAQESKRVFLQNATVYSGLQTVMMDVLFVPYEKILAWGEGEISLSETDAD